MKNDVDSKRVLISFIQRFKGVYCIEILKDNFDKKKKVFNILKDMDETWITLWMKLLSCCIFWWSYKKGDVNESFEILKV